MEEENKMLSTALSKKNERLEEMTTQLDSQKKAYEDKIKNLMNSINTLKAKCSKLESESSSDVRVNIIKELRNERKDQENIITLIRKKLGNDQETDKYLLKELDLKLGENRNPTYEDMKMRIRKLESEVILLKHKNTKLVNSVGNNNENDDFSEQNESRDLKFASRTHLSQTSSNKNTLNNNNNTSKRQKSTHFMSSNVLSNNFFKKSKNKRDDPEIREILKTYKQDYEREIQTYKEKISTLESHIEILTESNSKLENMQNDIFSKIKNYNSEVSEMKSIYDSIRKNLEDEYEGKMNKYKSEIKDNEETIKLLKEKLKEVIKTSTSRDEEDKGKIEKLTSELELLNKILNGKKQEVVILEDELNRLKEMFEKQDSKGIMKSKRNERESDDVRIKLKEQIEKCKYLEDLSNKKDFDIETLKNKIEELEECCVDNNAEIELLNMKLEELEEMNLTKSVVSY